MLSVWFYESFSHHSMQLLYNYQQNTIGTKTITGTFGVFVDLQLQRSS